MYRKHAGIVGESHQRHGLASHIASCILLGGFAGAVHDGNVYLSRRQVVVAPTGVLLGSPSHSTRLIRTEREQQSIAEVSQRNGHLNAPVYAQPVPLQAMATMSTPVPLNSAPVYVHPVPLQAMATMSTPVPLNSAPVYAQPVPLQAMATMSTPVPLNSTALSIAANTTFPVAMPTAVSSTLLGTVPISASTTAFVAMSNAGNTALAGAVPSSANTTAPGVSAFVPVVPGVSGVLSTENCSNVTTSSTGCTSHAQTWNHWFVIHMAPVLCVFVAMGISAMSPTKREKLQKEPFSWSARALGLIIAWNLLLMSLPKVGYMLAGCLWSSVSGLSTVLTLGAACVRPVCGFLEIPSVFGHLGCWKTATFLLSTGGSGIAFAVFFGDPVCAGTFVKLFILCCIDGGIFGWAWFKREDSMVMAAFNKMAG